MCNVKHCHSVKVEDWCDYDATQGLLASPSLSFWSVYPNFLLALSSTPSN